MALYNHRLGKKLNSSAMMATAIDSLSDSIATTAVLAATLVGQFFHVMIDGWCGILVACFILWSRLWCRQGDHRSPAGHTAYP